MLLFSQDPPMNKTQDKNQKQEKTPAVKSSAGGSGETSVQAQAEKKTQTSSTEAKKQTAKSSVEQKREAEKKDKQIEHKKAVVQEAVSATQKSEASKNTGKKTAVQKNSEDPKDNKKEQSQTALVYLQTLFAYKKGMTHIYNDKNQYIPVTALQYKPCRVTQIKTKEREGYTAVQVALESSKKGNKALQNHLKQAGFKNGACFVREVRQALPDNIQVGQEISIESLKEGDVIRLSSVSKGHGFSGVVKRWGFGGGPASHGAEKHRTTGSIANTATQGRVFPGKKMPGRFGCDRTTISNIKVVKVVPSEGFIFVKGSVPGAFQSLVELRKQGTV